MRGTKRVTKSPGPVARYCDFTSHLVKATHKTMLNSLISYLMLCLLGRATLTSLPEEVLDKLYCRDYFFGNNKVRSQHCLRLLHKEE